LHKLEKRLALPSQPPVILPLFANYQTIQDKWIKLLSSAFS